MIKRLGFLLVALALVAAACGDSSTETTEGTTATTTGGTDTTTATTTPTDTGQGGGTLAAVKARGELNCGVSTGAVAFTELQPDGSATGIDADYCRALAAAVLGDANAVVFFPTTAAERFDVLKAGDVDVLFRNTTWTASRDTDVGLDFGPTTYFDGQGLMGPANRFTATSGPSDVDGAILCTNAGTTTEKNIREWASLGGASITLETVENFSEAMDAFIAGRCDLVTTDASGLVGEKISRETSGEIDVDSWVVFPQAPISKEPLGPAYRQNDSEWADVVDWTVYSTFIAFEKGVNSTNVDAARAAAGTDAGDPELGRMFGDSSPEIMAALNLDSDAFYNVISQVGSYDEIFDRNLNPVGLFRQGGLNDLWTEGGLIYAPPFR
ncbi:MAG: amino acid ABC transporter substrate-binding protein [Acidimicrobiia bacterium]|nr:amino acid ABC transporter substrate-binding protein [Acidimicrobiia bacterium]